MIIISRINVFREALADGSRKVSELLGWKMFLEKKTLKRLPRKVPDAKNTLML